METIIITDVILWKRYKSDREGTVTLRFKKGTSRSYKSLGIPLESKYWNEATQRVKATDAVDYKTINATITRMLTEHTDVGEQGKISAKSIEDYLDYCQSVIASISSYGSRTKYTTVLNKLRVFLREKKGTNKLSFADLTPDFLRELHTYLLREVRRNTANHYMKVYNHFARKAMQERRHHYEVNPFVSVKYTNSKKVRSALSEEEIDRFRRCEVPPRLGNAHRSFIAQLFAQGMRVSDIMLLRWSDVVATSIMYVMYKTGKEMKVYINEPLQTILLQQALHYPAFDFMSKPQKLNYVQRAQETDPVVGKQSSTSDAPTKEMSPTILRALMLTSLGELSGSSYGMDFVFPFLKRKDFPEKVTRDTITERQYKLLHHAKIVYNRHLKEIQLLAGIDFTITSHAARHAYTNLLRTDRAGYDIYDISRTLGHSSLKTTESYLATFDDKHVMEVNQAIAKRLG